MSFNPSVFIAEKVREIADAVGDGLAINALSGGVDSSVVTLLAHRALGDRLRSVFIENDHGRTYSSRRLSLHLDVQFFLVPVSDGLFCI